MTKEGIRQYFVAALALVLTVWGVYHYAVVRYGVPGLSSLNKSFAISTLFLLGIVLLMGPLARQFTLFDRFLKYRKELGVLTFFTAASHLYFSNPFSFYQNQPVSAYFGLVAIGIMTMLLLLSFQALERLLPSKLWWEIQYWGARVSFVAILVHMTVLKFKGWSTWLVDRNPALPPLALLATLFALFVIVVRLGELFGMRGGRLITRFAFLTFISVTLWLFV